MIRMCCILFLLLAQGAAAQEPRIDFELESDSVVVGQPLVLRIKVLVPTWMPKPPEFPNIEVPSLMVRLPEQASRPVSERIDGETWSGVQRSYRLYPLQPGVFQLPAGKVRITYAEPSGGDPVAFAAPLPDIRIVAALPDGAGDLSPPIIAEAFALAQEVGGATDLKVGEAITRTLTARIEDTTPILIPQLAETEETPALRAYPKDPVVQEQEDRGTLSGSRTEAITYVAQADGSVTLPAITLDWFNLETDAVETASVPAIELTVTGAPPALPDPVEIVRMAVFVALFLLLLFGVYRWFRPTILGWVRKVRAEWRASERFAHHAVRAAMHRQDLSATSTALEQWKAVCSPEGEAIFKPLDAALADIGAARYGPTPGLRTADGWKTLKTAYASTRREIRTVQGRTHRPALPPLNP